MSFKNEVWQAFEDVLTGPSDSYGATISSKSNYRVLVQSSVCRSNQRHHLSPHHGRCRCHGKASALLGEQHDGHPNLRGNRPRAAANVCYSTLLSLSYIIAARHQTVAMLREGGFPGEIFRAISRAEEAHGTRGSIVSEKPVPREWG